MEGEKGYFYPPVRESLFIDNQANGAPGDGGAIQSWMSFGLSSVESSTFVGNAASEGGAIACSYSGNATLRGVTLTGNQATKGGGIACTDIEIEGSIVYGNTAGTGPDLFGAVESLGYNLIGDTTGATINGTSTGNLIGVDPQLGSLADNGGPTETCALPEGSSAVDTGPPDCAGLTTDQRGYPRPLDGDHDGAAECDIGAFELDHIFSDGFESGDTSVWSASTI